MSRRPKTPPPRRPPKRARTDGPPCPDCGLPYMEDSTVWVSYGDTPLCCLDCWYTHRELPLFRLPAP